MNGSVERLELEPDRPFGISRGTTEHVENVVVRLEHDGRVGLGAAAPSSYYGETAGTVEAVLPDLLAVAERAGDPHALQRVRDRMDAAVGGNPAAKAAVDVALHDLAAREAGLPLYRYLGLDPDRSVTSSYTVSLGDAPRMRRAAEEAVRAGYEVLKVKLGGAQDEEALAAVREAAPDATVRVDANAAWTPREAVRMCEVCAEYDVEFVEQPVPPSNREGMRLVYERSPLPVVADESCVALADVPRVAGVADVVNVKLMKCGGVREAVRLVHAARAHGLEVMLGCMLETDVSIAAAAHLTPLVDYADLDGSLLLADDPYEGVPMPGGEVDLEAVERPGTGVRERDDS